MPKQPQGGASDFQDRPPPAPDGAGDKRPAAAADAGAAGAASAGAAPIASGSAGASATSGASGAEGASSASGASSTGAAPGPGRPVAERKKKYLVAPRAAPGAAFGPSALGPALGLQSVEQALQALPDIDVVEPSPPAPVWRRQVSARSAWPVSHRPVVAACLATAATAWWWHA